MRSIICFVSQIRIGNSGPYISRLITNFIIIFPEWILASLISIITLHFILMINIIRLLFYWLFKVIISLLEIEWNIIYNRLLNSLNLIIWYGLVLSPTLLMHYSWFVIILIYIVLPVLDLMVLKMYSLAISRGLKLYCWWWRPFTTLLHFAFFNCFSFHFGPLLSSLVAYILNLYVI